MLILTKNIKEFTNEIGLIANFMEILSNQLFRDIFLF